jgi:hypothetical protein
MQYKYLLTEKLWLLPGEAAQELRVCPKTIYRITGDGDLVCAKIRGSLRIFAPSLDDYVHGKVQEHSLESGRYSDKSGLHSS